MQSPPPQKRLAVQGKWPTPPRPVAPPAAPADGPRAIAAPQTAGQEPPPAGSYLLRARLSRGTTKVKRVPVDCLRLKGDGEDGAIWIDSTGGVVATKASYRFTGSGSLALGVVPPSGKYEGYFSDDSGRHRDFMTLTFTRTGAGACTVNGKGRSQRYGPYEMRGRGTRDGDDWNLSLVRTPGEEYSEEAQALLVTDKTCLRCGNRWPMAKMYCDPGCGAPLTERARIEAATRALEAAPDDAARAAAHHQLLEAQQPPRDPWLADCPAPLELRQYVIDGEDVRALDFLQENYVDERHQVAAERIYAGKFLRVCRMQRHGGGGLYTFGASSPGLAGQRAAVQGYSNLLSHLENMEQTRAFKAAPKTVRRGARLARQGRWYDYKEGDVLDQCQLRVVPSFWGRVDGSPSSTPSARRATASASRIVTVLFMQAESNRLRDFVRPNERGVQLTGRADGSTVAFGRNAPGHRVRWVRRANPASAAAFSRRTNPRVRQAGDDEAWGARRVVELATETGMLDQVPEAIKVLASRGPVVAGAPPLLTAARRDHGRKIAAPLLAVADRGILAASRDLGRVHVALDIWPPSDKGDQRCFFVGNAEWSPPGVADIVTDVYHRGVALHGAAGDGLMDYIDEQLFAWRVPELLFLALDVDIFENAAARRVVRERFRFGTVLRDGIVLRQSIVFAERTVLLIAGMESCLWSAWAKFWVTLASTYLRADWQAATLRSNQAAREAQDTGEPPRRFRDTLPQVLAVFGEDAARGAARNSSAVDTLMAQLTAGMASLCPVDEKEFLRRVDDVVPARRAELGLQ